MDWQKWKKVRREAKENYDVNKVISFAKDQINDSKRILDEIKLDKKYIIFDLETSGLKERYPQDKSKKRQQEQILQVAALAGFYRKENGTIEFVPEDKLDITAYLKDDIKSRLDKDSVEYRLYLLHRVNTFLNDKTYRKEGGPVQINKLNDVKNLPDDLRKEVSNFVQNFKNTQDILDMTGYKEENATASEEDALKSFFAFIEKHPGSILSGHNIINFDLGFVKQRAAEYDVPQKIENIDNILDTLDVARNVFQPTLDILENKFSDIINNINSQLKVKIQVPSLNEDKEQAEIFNRIQSTLEKEIEEHPEEERELAKIGSIFGLLLFKVSQVKKELTNPKTGRRTSSQGPLAKLFKIDSSGWHNALADIEMLSKVYRDMYLFLDLAQKYTGNTLPESIIQEIEPYQKKMHDKHPHAKKTMISHGNNKYKGTPFKIKLSTKRAKSAPPIGE